MCSNDARKNDARTLRQDIPANFGPHVIDRRTKWNLTVFLSLWKFHLSHSSIYFLSIMGNSPPLDLFSKIHRYGQMEPIDETHYRVFLWNHLFSNPHFHQYFVIITTTDAVPRLVFYYSSPLIPTSVSAVIFYSSKSVHHFLTITVVFTPSR